MTPPDLDPRRRQTTQVPDTAAGVGWWIVVGFVVGVVLTVALLALGVL